MGPSEIRNIPGAAWTSQGSPRKMPYVPRTPTNLGRLLMCQGLKEMHLLNTGWSSTSLSVPADVNMNIPIKTF